MPRFSFTLRWLLIFFAVSSIPLALFSSAARRRAHALRVLRTADAEKGIVEVYFRAMASSPRSETHDYKLAARPKWQVLPDDYLLSPHRVHFQNSSFDSYHVLADLPDLVRVDIVNCKKFDDEAVEDLSASTSLQKLCVSLPGRWNILHPLSPKCVDHLKNMKSLRSLSIYRATLDESWVAALKRMTQLEELELGVPEQIGPEAMAELQAALPNCKVSHVGRATNRPFDWFKK